MKKVLIAVIAVAALTACSAKVSNIEIAKAEHACQVQGAAVDYIHANAQLPNTVVCTNGEQINLKKYNPHKQAPQQQAQLHNT